MCVACSSSSRAASVLCAACSSRLAAAKPRLGAGPAGVDRAWSSAPLEGVARSLVQALETRHLPAVAALMAERVATLAPAHLLTGTIVPFLQRHPRAARPSLDPPAALAAALAKRIDAPLDPSSIQATGAAPRNALLIATVLGKDARLTGCARTLRDSGARRVVVVSFAQR